MVGAPAGGSFVLDTTHVPIDGRLVILGNEAPAVELLEAE